MHLSRSIVLGHVGCLLAGVASAQPPAPRPVVAWAAGPMEARVAFDRAVDPELAARVVGGTIAFGEGPKPGRAGRPEGDRGTIRIAAARLVDDGRTLSLVTDPHPRATTYRLALPALKAAGAPGPGSPAEVAYDLGGVEVSWAEGEGTKPAWSGWWPVVDPGDARKLAAGSAEHDRLWPLTSKPGRLTLRTQVARASASVTLDLDAFAPFEATFGDETTRSASSSPDAHRATLKAEAAGEPVELSLAIRAGDAGVSKVRVSDAQGPLPRAAFLLPWAPATPPPAPETTIPAEFRAGGDPARGEAAFYSEAAKCSACHMVRGKGGVIGPDLSDLAGRDRAWVYQNIVEPSASIHPAYVSYTVAMKDGQVAMGVVRAEGADALKVGAIDGKQSTFPRAEVEEIRPSTSSIMPVGLLGGIGEEQARDLLAFLTNPRPPAAPGR